MVKRKCSTLDYEQREIKKRNMPRHDDGGGEATPLLVLCCSLRGFQPKKHLKREMFSDFLLHNLRIDYNY